MYILMIRDSLAKELNYIRILKIKQCEIKVKGGESSFVCTINRQTLQYDSMKIHNFGLSD